MKIHIAASAAILCILSTPAFAQSSVVVGIPGDVVRYGVSFGVAVNQADHDAADEVAMAHCRNGPDVTPTVRDLCRPVARFDNRCVAVSLDPRAGTPGFGWAIADVQDDADAEALAGCRKTDGDQGEACVITLRMCDGMAGQ